MEKSKTMEKPRDTDKVVFIFKTGTELLATFFPTEKKKEPQVSVRHKNKYLKSIVRTSKGYIRITGGREIFSRYSIKWKTAG